ncbi:MAG: hypothetical protein U0359_22030 [Byssovorax sp.]
MHPTQAEEHHLDGSRRGSHAGRGPTAPPGGFAGVRGRNTLIEIENLKGGLEEHWLLAQLKGGEAPAPRPIRRAEIALLLGAFVATAQVLSLIVWLVASPVSMAARATSRHELERPREASEEAARAAPEPVDIGAPAVLERKPSAETSAPEDAPASAKDAPVSAKDAPVSPAPALRPPAARVEAELTTERAGQAMARALGAARRCKVLDGAAGHGSARVTFRPSSGKAVSVGLQGPFFGPGRRCLASAFAAARVAPFGGQSVIVNLPFSINLYAGGQP